MNPDTQIGIDQELYHSFHRMAKTGQRITLARAYYLDQGKQLTTSQLEKIVDLNPFESFIKPRKK